jgi:hypothetical protein
VSYYRRVYTGSTEMDEVVVFERQADGTLMITAGVPYADVPDEVKREPPIENTYAESALVIYGDATLPDDAHDREHALFMRKRGQVYGKWFSVIETSGEYGTHPLATLTEISSAEFEQARKRGWAC